MSKAHGMRFSSLLLFFVASAAAAVACSSSDGPTVTPATPEGGASSSGGDGTPDPDGGSIVPGEDGAAPAYVKTTTETFQHEGGARIYILSVPVDYDANKKYPVYLFMHGNPGDAEGMLNAFPVDPVTKNEAVVVYPNAATIDWDHTLKDNTDVTYLKALIDEVAAKVSIDPQRILLSGWSGGGFMASQVACRYASLFRAIGIHAGGAPYDPENGDPNYTPACAGAAIATIVTHGTSDGAVDVGSGTYAAQYWAEHAGCQGTKSASSPDPCMAYDGCPADKPVKVCIIEGGSHPLWNRAHEVTWDWFKSLP